MYMLVKLFCSTHCCKLVACLKHCRPVKYKQRRDLWTLSSSLFYSRYLWNSPIFSALDTSIKYLEI